MTDVIATVRGVALSPGVSRNRRLYTPDLLAKAYARAQARIGEGVRPMSMRTHHAAGDDSTRITGHLSELNLGADGRIRYAGVIEGTDAGRTIATLVDNRGKAPSLRGVSIRGNWIGPVRTVLVDGYGPCETADDLEIVGLDFTGEPGVDDAGVDDVEFTAGSPQETVGDRHPITESVEEASVTITEQATATITAQNAAPTTVTLDVAGARAPVGNEPRYTVTPVVRETTTAPRRYADLGYRNGERRYPLDTLEQTFESWAGLNDPDLSGYTAPQLKRMRQRVKGAAVEHGAQITTEGWMIAPARAVAEGAPVGESWLGGDASFSIRLSNGPIDICVSSWYVDPGQLEPIARAAMAGACTALAAIDPDGDGSIDVLDIAVESTPETTGAQGAGETGAVTETAPATTPTGTPAGTTSTEEAAVSEPTTPAAAAQVAPPMIALTTDQFAQLLAAAGGQAAAPAAAPVESAPVAQAAPAAAPAAQPAAVAQPAAATETAPAAAAVTETEDQRIARLVQEGIAAQMPGLRAVMAQEFVQAQGGIGRRGLAAGGVTVGESAAGGVTVGGAPTGLPAGLPQKPLHTYDPNETAQLDRYVAGAILGDPHMLGSINPGA